MLRIEVKSNQDYTAMKNKINCKKTNTLEAIYLMSVAYNLIKQNDEVGITDKEIFDNIKNMNKVFEDKRKKAK